MPHVALLGDSIFDNAAYVPGRPAVVDQLRNALPDEWTVSLLAVDGHVTEDVVGQLESLPDGVTHLVVSSGGNDALNYLPVLSEAARSVAEVMDRFAAIRADFRGKYRRMLERLLRIECEVAVCTVYDRVPGLEPMAHAALAMFNEIILREAFEAKVSLIDLRLVCTDFDDYSELSPIEPSAAGGEKISSVVRDLLLGTGESRSVIKVYT